MKKMKSSGDKLCGISGIIVQIAVAYCAWQGHWACMRYWKIPLKGAALPQMTVLSLVSFRYIPLIAAVLIGLAFVIPVLTQRIVWWTLLIALLEILSLTVVIMGLGFSAYSLPS
jgi:hypothetical protein